MKVTNVKVNRVANGEGGLKAFCDIVFDDAFCVHGLRILETQNGDTVVAMPARKVKDAWKDIAHPINAETRKEIVEAVLEEYNKPDSETVSDVAE